MSIEIPNDDPEDLSAEFFPPRGETIKEALCADKQDIEKVEVGEFLAILGEGLWHTTSLPRYNAILRSGSISPNPDIPDAERWYTGGGPEHYPYVRFIGGVSLFDFKGFDPSKYDEKYRASSWRHFVPVREKWGSAVWIEIDRRETAGNYLDPKRLLDKWHEENARGHMLMPMLEAAHIGPIPLAAISRALLVGGEKGGIVALPPIK